MSLESEQGGAELAALGKRPFGWNEHATFVLTRGALLRGMGFIFAVAFFSSSRQLAGLIGSHGILPAAHFVEVMRSRAGFFAWLELPTLFYVKCTDGVLFGACYAGLALSFVAMLGLANAAVMAALWALYMSFVHVGQVFYGFGWELLTLEAGFLAIFLAPVWNPRAPSSVPVPVIWLFRWVTFRVMFGAGLIKLRGDPCWVHLTCLVDHYETQPNPNPLSYYFHALPLGVEKASVLFNHFVELIVPWGLFGPRRIRHVAGGLIVLFQGILILSGNLSFLNWLTIVVTLSAFDDSLFERLLPTALRERAWTWSAACVDTEPSVTRRRVIVGLAVSIGVLSVAPTINLISPDQAMNASFDPLHLVNTYGAFGSVEHERHEVVLEGTWDDALADGATWHEYEFPCKPGDPRRRPCFVSPYHYRLDWQMWFAGLSDVRREPWLVKLVSELLHENPAVTGLLAKDPFAGRPPRYVRALLYRYRFAKRRKDGWWERSLIGEYLRPLSVDDAGLKDFLEGNGW
jgi:hypothetical protein